MQKKRNIKNYKVLVWFSSSGKEVKSSQWATLCSTLTLEYPASSTAMPFEQMNKMNEKKA